MILELLGLKWVFTHCLFLGLGGGGSSGSSSTSSLPGWASTYIRGLAPIGQQYASEIDPTGGTLRAQAANTLGQEVTGANLDPSTNPALQKIEANTQQQAAQQFGLDTNAMLGQANQGGALYSSGAQAAVADAARKMGTDVAGQTANLENQNYQMQTGIQANAVPAAAGFNMDNLNAAIQLANMMRGWRGQGGSSQAYGDVTLQPIGTNN